MHDKWYKLLYASMNVWESRKMHDTWQAWVLSINPSANVLVFEDFNFHHRDRLTYSCGTGRTGKFCHNFPYSWSFLLRKLSYSDPRLWLSQPDSFELFLFSGASTSAVASPPLKNSDHIFISVFIDFPSTQREMPFFIPQLMPVLLLIGTVCMIIREMLHERILLNLVLLLLVLTFVRVTLLKLVYISIYHKYQIKPHSSQCFSAACAAAITHRNHFFHLYQQNKSSVSKVKFR